MKTWINLEEEAMKIRRAIESYPHGNVPSVSFVKVKEILRLLIEKVEISPLTLKEDVR